MQISNVYTRIEPKVSVLWHWNSVNKASMLLSKDVSNNVTKTMFSIRDVIKSVLDHYSYASFFNPLSASVALIKKPVNWFA